MMEVDVKLIQACSKGDRKAQHELYQLCFAPLLSVCYRFANNKDDAAILLNESFYRILNNIDKHQLNSSFMAWAKRITINYCIDQYKKDNVRKRHLSPVHDPDDLEQQAELVVINDETSDASPELLEKVRKEILNLPKTTQEVFQLFILEGYSHQEIAEILDMKEGTSKWHVNNARTILKSVLKRSLKMLSSIAL